MSAINLYTTKQEALYFKDSQRNSFYEFGGIQLLPNNTYTQKVTIALKNPSAISVLKIADDSVIGSVPYEFNEETNINTIYAASNTIYAANNIIRTDSFSNSIFYMSITPIVDFGNELIYLKLHKIIADLFILLLPILRGYKSCLTQIIQTFAQFNPWLLRNNYLSSSNQDL